MPTIELVVVGRNKLLPIKSKGSAFYIRQSKKLNSDRALFQDFLKTQKGVLLHLGNKDLNSRGFFFAGDLIEDDFSDETINIPCFSDGETGNDQLDLFRFKSETFPSIIKLLQKVIKYSPEQLLHLYTDYQFGPSKALFYHKPVTIAEFEQIHTIEGLRWNMLYTIYIS